MNKVGLISFILFFAAFSFGAGAAEIDAAEPGKVVQRYLAASQNGDVDTMKACISGPYYEKRRDLLENNKSYPDFLRDYFDGVRIDVVEVRTQDDDGSAIAVLKSQPREGAIIYSKLILKKDQMGKWKIFDELFD
jgi:hypothetical protein